MAEGNLENIKCLLCPIVPSLFANHCNYTLTHTLRRITKRVIYPYMLYHWIVVNNVHIVYNLFWSKLYIKGSTVGRLNCRGSTVGRLNCRGSTVAGSIVMSSNIY